MKQIVLGFFMFFVPLIASSQTMAVSSFKALEYDLTAWFSTTGEIDQNGERAALIKVVTTQTGFSFDVGALGIVKVKQTPGEVWVFIPKGAKQITIKHPQLGVLRDYKFPVKIESAQTYEMVLQGSQTMAVSSFKMLANDLTANTYDTQVLDLNGYKTALIKVVTDQTGFFFEGNSISKVMQTPGEVWVYISGSSKYLTIKHPQFGVLRRYKFPVKIESARTYEMVLATNEVNQGGEYATNAKVLSAEEANKKGDEYYNKKDYNEALKWYRKAADQGNAKAMNNIGLLYEKGNGVPQNYQTAKEWYKKALNKDPNHTKAKDNLARVEKKIPELSNSNNNYAQNSNISQPKAKPQPKEEPKPIVEPKPKVEPQPKVGTFMVDTDIPVNNRVNSNTFAIIIANENYGQGVSKVDYARNDGEVFKEYCHKTLGLPDKNVRFVPDATYAQLFGELNWLEELCEKYKGEASVIFYYAGHGIPDEDKSSYLLPVDGNTRLLKRTCLSLNELYATLGNLPAQKVTVLMDACFSGAKRDGDMLKSGRLGVIKAKEGAVKGNTIVLSAAKGDEIAYKYDDAKHGLFTYFLLKKLKESKGSVTMGELSQYIQDQVGRYSIVEVGKSQTPNVQASDALKGTWESLHLE